MFEMSKNDGGIVDNQGVEGSNKFTELGNLLLTTIYLLPVQAHKINKLIKM